MCYNISLKYLILTTVVLLQKLSESTTVNCGSYKTNTTVQGPPIMTKPKDKRVIYKLWYTGKPAYLHCCTSGNPSPTVKWFKDGHKIDFTDFRFNLKSSNQTLSIIPLRLADYGMYTCQSINRFGNESRTFKVDVKSSLVFQKPVVILKHNPWNAIVHSNITLNCIVKKSARRPRILWFLNRTSPTPLNFQQKGQYFVSKTTEMDEDQTWMSNLTIRNVTMNNTGVYMCQATNGAGSGKAAQDSGVLTIQEPSTKKPLTLERAKTTTESPGPKPVIYITIAAIMVSAVLIIIVFLWWKKKHSRTPGIISNDVNHIVDPAKRLISIDSSNEIQPVSIPLLGNCDNETVDFDVFISYSSQDRDFVKNILFLELSTTHSVCIDFKDFEPGLYIGDNIWKSIFRSKKTLLVVSKNFLSGLWTHFEMQIAQGRLAHGQDVLIPVIIEDIPFDELPKPLQYYRQTKTYLEYFNEDVRPHFWDRLRSTLGPSLREYQDNKQQAEDDASTSSHV